MTGNRPHATFNIGSQHGNVNNVAGDQVVHGGQRYAASPAELIGRDLATIRDVIAAMPLDPAVRERATAFLSDASLELGRPARDGGGGEGAAQPIERLTRLLRDAGALSAAGAALADPLQHIALWLGTAGQAIAHLIT
jgi:hypothetical protein